MISTSPRDTERMTLRTNEIGFPDKGSLLMASKLSPTLEIERASVLTCRYLQANGKKT